MTKRLIETPNGPPPRGAYSAALRAGQFIYVSGQSSRDGNLRIVGSTIEDQTRKTIENIAAILGDADADLGHVVKATVHLSDLGDFQRYNAIYEQIFPEPRPTRTTVGSVLAPGVLVEIDVVAYVG